MASNKINEESFWLGFFGVVFGLFILDTLIDKPKKVVQPTVEDDPNAGFRQDAIALGQDRARLHAQMTETFEHMKSQYAK
jgi:hypothetical protein